MGKSGATALKKYKNKKHLLAYNSLYELLVMVILFAQDSDKNVNNLAPKFFEEYPDFHSLSNAAPDLLLAKEDNAV